MNTIKYVICLLALSIAGCQQLAAASLGASIGGPAGATAAMMDTGPAYYQPYPVYVPQYNWQAAEMQGYYLSQMPEQHPWQRY